MIHESTKPPTKRQRHRETRTRELVDLAWDIVAREGVQSLTMPRLADDAGAAVGGLYRYFDGKDALVAAIQVRGIEAFSEVFEDELSRLTPGSRSTHALALARVMSAARAWSRFAHDQPTVYALVDGSLSDPTPLLPDAHAVVVHRALTPILTKLTDLLDHAVALGALSPGPSDVRTHALWAVVHGVQHFAKRDRLMPAALHAAAVRREILSALLLGWGAAPAVLGELDASPAPPLREIP